MLVRHVAVGVCIVRHVAVNVCIVRRHVTVGVCMVRRHVAVGVCIVRHVAVTVTVGARLAAAATGTAGGFSKAGVDIDSTGGVFGSTVIRAHKKSPNG